MGDTMLSIFKRKPATAPPAQSIDGGFTAPESASNLLGTPRRRTLLENIWQRTSLSRKQFGNLYLTPLEKYAALVQHLPASENHHHAYLGGMLDHGLEIVAYALKIRQTYLLPIGAPPESQAAQAEAWSAAAAYGALIHDLGKIAVDVTVELQNGKTWHPWYGPIAQPYRFKYVKGRNYKLHSAASSLIYSQVLPAEALDWLSGFPELWAQLLFTLAGQHEYADIIGEIVTQADQASVAQELGGNTERAMAAPKQSLQRQLVDGLRMLVKEKFKLNHEDGPSDGWLTQDALWLVSKPAVDQLRVSLLAQGIEHIPSSNAPMFNMLQDQAIIQTNAKDKAIWSVTIDNGHGWLKTFTVLKVSPALIWPDAGERPESYGGTVTIEQAEPVPEDPPAQEMENSALTNDSSDSILISKSLQIVQNAPQPLLQSDSDHMDDLLSLFEDTSVAPNPVATTAIVHSTPTQASVENLETSPPRMLRQQRPPPPIDLPLEDSQDNASAGDYGSKFLAWLKTGVISHKIIINDAKARVHTVAGTAFLVSPDIFKRYALEHPDIEAVSRERQLEAWQLVQRAFEKKKRHRKTPDQLNIWTCQVKGPRKTRELRGYLLTDPTDVFSEVPYDNAILALMGSSDDSGSPAL
ncbi:MobH family relaxase [Pseudomonas sp. JUb42]|uniref:MobH family relaxase n=1 Tax=Pseudomonas sp. JUb42 TaxID=2940611 RepID=UPI00216852F0|nr:MobH family relaxase [Pseudomonas sp. JUb42]